MIDHNDNILYQTVFVRVKSVHNAKWDNYY